MKILIIEDDSILAATLQESLRAQYSVDTASTSQQGIQRLRVLSYDLIILDLGLPDLSGTETCQQIRHMGVNTPILILTGQLETKDKVDALDSGADDYLTKPFSFEELSARIRALLRRMPVTAQTVLELDGLRLDPAARTVTRNGHEVNLRRKEFDLLEYFMRNPNRVLTREAILEHIWESGNDPFANTVNVHIKYLRDKIGAPYDSLLQTVHGVGYKLVSSSPD